MRTLLILPIIFAGSFLLAKSDVSKHDVKTATGSNGFEAMCWQADAPYGVFRTGNRYIVVRGANGTRTLIVSFVSDSDVSIGEIVGTVRTRVDVTKSSPADLSRFLYSSNMVTLDIDVNESPSNVFADDIRHADYWGQPVQTDGFWSMGNFRGYIDTAFVNERIVCHLP